MKRNVSDEDLELFNKVLSDNIRMLLGNVDPVILRTFQEKVVNRIRTLDIYPWDYEDSFVNREIHGYTEYSRDGKTAIKMYGLNASTFEKSYIEQIFSHELWHAIMVILNNMCGSCSERSILYGKDNYLVHNYSGFLECSSETLTFTPGAMIADSLAQMLALAVVNKGKSEDFIIDDVFNYGIGVELNSPVDDLLTFFQLFVSAFSLSYVNWMNNNYNNDKGLIDSTIVNTNSKVVPANIFISGSLTSPISVMDEYDRFTSKGAYIDLLKCIDNLYWKYIDLGQFDVKGFIKVAKCLKEFNHSRLNYYLNTAVISLEEYKKLIRIFNEHYEAFMKEIGAYRVKSSKIKFQKIVNKVVKKRIK